MNYLGKIVKRIFRVLEGNLIALGFTRATGVEPPLGGLVYIKSDGTVDNCTSGTQFPIGYVTTLGSSSDKHDTGEVTVATCLSADLYAPANGAVTTGTLLSPAGIVDGVCTYKTAVNGEYASAIALDGGADTETIRVGVLRTPVKLDPAV